MRVGGTTYRKSGSVTCMNDTQISQLAERIAYSDEILPVEEDQVVSYTYDNKLSVGDQYRKIDTGDVMTVIGFSRRLDEYNRSLRPEGVINVHTVTEGDDDSQELEYGSPLDMIASMISTSHNPSFVMYEPI